MQCVESMRFLKRSQCLCVMLAKAIGNLLNTISIGNIGLVTVMTLKHNRCKHFCCLDICCEHNFHPDNLTVVNKSRLLEPLRRTCGEGSKIFNAMILTMVMVWVQHDGSDDHDDDDNEDGDHIFQRERRSFSASQTATTLLTGSPG